MYGTAYLKLTKFTTFMLPIACILFMRKTVFIAAVMLTVIVGTFVMFVIDVI